MKLVVISSKKKEYLGDKITDRASHIKGKNIRGLYIQD
jgi:hypothetical protein